MSEEIFEAFVAPHLKGLRTFVGARMRSQQDIDDIVQQTLLRAFRGRDQLRCVSKFKSWLWSIAVNEIRQFLRGGHRFVSLEECPAGDFADLAPSALATCEQMEQEERLRAGIASLSMRHRMAIQLVDLNGVSCSDAAGAMAVSAGAFKSIHFRARQRLGRALRMTSKRAKDPGAVVRELPVKAENKECRRAA